MIVRFFQNRLNSIASNHAHNGRLIYSSEEFKKLLSRERARADRGGREFSVIVFGFATKNDMNNFHKILAKHIFHRIRLADEVGWIGNKSLGLLLVDVNGYKAWKVVEELKQSIPNEIPKITYNVLSYPLYFTSDDGPGFRTDRNSYKIKSSYNPEYKAWQYTENNPDNFCKNGSSIQGLEPLFAPIFPAWKRIMDITGALAGLILLFPFFLLIAVLIKSICPGPVFFKQQRLGCLGRPFTLWKFRTMIVNADCENHKNYVCGLIKHENPMDKMDDNDLQIIPFIGKFLRNLCIDELPQLINVLLGDMSLVGPRPCLQYEFDQYLLWHRRRILTVPGMTGLWQVSGKNRTTFKEMIRFDIAYEEQMSFWFDIFILLKTVGFIAEQAVNHILLKGGQSDASYV